MSSQAFWRRYALWICVALCFSPLLCHAQLNVEQKLHDFRQLVAFYERTYAGAAWKKQVFGFDLSDEQPWLTRVAHSADDIEFMELCAEYVASLNDSHSSYRILRSEWSAKLGFSVDSYVDGPSEKILIDRIDRTLLPAGQYPFQVGDELVSVDGVGVEDWIRRLSKWTHASNPRTKRSLAAMAIVSRQQIGGTTVAAFPRAPLETGDHATMVIRRASGDVETYTIRWQEIGVPVLKFGPVYKGLYARTATAPTPHAPISHLQADLQASVQNPSVLKPVFALPAGFQQRLGNGSSDSFFTGLFPAEGLQVGYVRIPSFAPQSGSVAQFQSEVAYMQANTDAMVIDIMHNGGGSPPYADQLFSNLSPTTYQVHGAVWRPTLAAISLFVAIREQLPANADPKLFAFYDSLLEQFRLAYERGDALTDPIPITGTTFTGQPAKDAQGNVLAYTKPIMLLTNEWSVSAADGFAAQFQDNERGIVFGTRTNGAGGLVNSGRLLGSYSQGTGGAEVNLLVRNQVINVPGYPPTRYLDNVGVHPDIVEDFATRENLMNGGATFSARMVAAIAQYARQGAQ